MSGPRRLGVALALAIAGSLALSAPATADRLAAPWLNFAYDPAVGVEAGVISTHSLGDVVALYDAGLSRLIGWTPRTQGRWVLGVAGRVMQSVLIDLPIVSLQATLIHEVFGHGSRAQPWGASPTYSFSIPFPYNWIFKAHSETSGLTTDADTGQRERGLTMVAGGMEAEYYSAYRIELDAVRSDGRIPHMRQLLYIAAKLVYMSSFLDPLNSDRRSSDDVHNYVVELADRFNRFRFVDRVAVADRVRDAYIGNFLDPTLWLAVYGYLIEYIGHGHTHFRLPRLMAGPVSLYASSRFALSPFGAEHYLDLFARFAGRTFTVYGRAVSSGLATAWGVGLKGLELMRFGGLGVGAELDIWAQPEMLFDPADVNVFDRPQRGGVSLALDLDWKIAWRLGVTGKIGWKTDGWLMGQPLGEGPYGWIGLAVYTDAEGALFKWRT